MTDFLRDPTVAFCISVVLAPVGLLAWEGHHPLGELLWMSLPGYLLSPTMLASYLYLFLVVKFAHSGGRWGGGSTKPPPHDTNPGGVMPTGRTVRLNPRDTRAARWFLMNGVYFNLFLDVVSGQFQANSLMTWQYNFVEPRYRFGAMDIRGASVFWTSMCELFFQSPLALMCYYGYMRGKAWRRPLEIIVSVLHVAGVWWFYVPEAYANFPHLGGWPATWAEALTFHRLFYFYFGFWFMGAVWTIAAIMIATTAVMEIAAIIDESKFKEQ